MIRSAAKSCDMCSRFISTERTQVIKAYDPVGAPRCGDSDELTFAKKENELTVGADHGAWS